MFRGMVLFAVCVLFCLPSLAQTFEDKPEPLSSSSDLRRAANPNAGSPKLAAPSISVLRLREPRKAQELYNKALDAWVKHRPDEAQQKLDQALKIYSTFPEALALCGAIEGSLRHWDSAELKLKVALQTDPTYSPALIILAGVCNAQRRFEAAQQAIQQARSLGDDSWLLHYETARTLIGMRQYEEAFATSEEGLQSKPDAGLLHLSKAHALLGLRRYPEAAAELHSYLRLEPAGEGSQQARNFLEQIQQITAR